MHITAIVPMRHHSERVPQKNYRSFAGKPLFHHVVSTLCNCQSIDEIVVDTDSPTIIDDVSAAFRDVRIIERPAHLRAGDTPMNDVLLNTVSKIKADLFLQTHSTNPLLQSATIDDAIKRFVDANGTYDSAFGVTRLQTRLWDQVCRPVNHNQKLLLRTQDLPPIFEENSTLYLFSADVLKRHHNRIGERPLMIEVPKLQAVDIDDESDFLLAETLFKASQRAQP